MLKGLKMEIRDEPTLTSAAEDVASAIEQASFGLVSWASVTQMVSDLFPAA